jgi:hypothetical protein
LVIFLILFKNRSTSSEGCPEKLGKSSNRALRAFVNKVESAMEAINDVVSNFGFLRVRVCNLSNESVIRLCESNGFLSFLTADLVPEAVLREICIQ